MPRPLFWRALQNLELKFWKSCVLTYKRNSWKIV